jgi:tetratricopeptide (TPR) repeat protein
MSGLALLLAVAGCMEETNRAAGSDVDRPDGGLEEADRHFEAGRFSRALRTYQMLQDGEPDEVPYGRLQRSYLALGLAAEARALALRRRAAGVAEAGPGAWHCDMGMIAIQAGDTAALAMHTDSLTRIAADLQQDADPRLVECLAFHQVFARRFADAQRNLEWLAAIDASQPPPPNLAFLYLRQGRRESADPILSEAERGASEAAAAHPDDPEPHFELAEFAAMRGEVVAAVAAFSEAMDRGLGRTWWIYQLFDPKAIPDPVFESLYGNPDFERMRGGVVEERERMLAESSPGPTGSSP